jgi:hypothetical protein
MSNASDRKKFMFYDTAKRQADLRIRLQYDGMNQSEFFRAMITGYLEGNSELMMYLDNYKQAHAIQGDNKRRTSVRMAREAERTKKKFALDKNEIEDIFDLIEKEHPDL